MANEIILMSKFPYVVCVECTFTNFAQMCWVHIHKTWKKNLQGTKVGFMSHNGNVVLLIVSLWSSPLYKSWLPKRIDGWLTSLIHYNNFHGCILFITLITWTPSPIPIMNVGSCNLFVVAN